MYLGPNRLWYNNSSNPADNDSQPNILVTLKCNQLEQLLGKTLTHS